jgi:FMN reductase
MNIVSLLGSPSVWSRSAWLIERAGRRLAASGEHRVQTIALRELPAEALLRAEVGRAGVREAIAAVAAADVVLVSTPIYKAAYSGLLKTFLDLLPQDGLRGKTVLPMATGGSPGHLLALDYALKPVLHALGARLIIDSVFAVDTQLVAHVTQGYLAEDALVRRLERAVQAVLDAHPAPVKPVRTAPASFALSALAC